MQAMQNKERDVTLQDVVGRCRRGYAHDLAVGFLRPHEAMKGPTALDADALFRTLVLDERWDVRDAELAYCHAMATIDDND